MKNYKTVLYSAVIYSVIIGAVYVTLAILALLSRWCVIEMTASPVVYMMFLLYFRVPNCETQIQWDLLDVTNMVVVNMPNETELVNRTFIFVIVSLGLHVALIVTALYGLCGVNNSCLGRKSFLVFIAPWVFVWVAIIVLDVLASVYFVIDTISAMSVDGIMDLLEITATNEVRASFEQLASHHKYLPPILMLLASSKLFIFFIINIVWVVFIVKAGWTASTYHKYLDKTRRNYENTMANVNPAFEGLRDDIVAQKQHERQMGYLADQSSIQEIAASTTSASAPPPDPTETRYNDTARIQAAVYPYQMPQQKQQQTIEEEPKYKIQRPTTLTVTSVERPQSQQQQYYRNEPEIDSRLSRYQETNGHVIKTIEPLNDIPEQQQSNTRIRVLPPVVQTNRQLNETKPQMARSQSEMRQKPIPPPKPQTNRYSMQPGGNESPVLYRPDKVNNSRVERNSSSIRAPDELRSQLPWSYFKPREDAPKRAFNNLDENEETPAVPVPDYTLHYGRRERTKLSDSDGDGSWNHQRY